MKKLTAVLNLIATAHILAGAASAGANGVLRVYPVGSQTRVAVELHLQPGQGLGGVQWYNNDETSSFPELVLLEATAGQPPDLQDPAIVLAQLSGPSSGWGEALLEEPVSSSTGAVWAVYSYPEFQELMGTGNGGGPGIGVRDNTTSQRVFLSYEGTDWVGLASRHTLAVDPVLAQGKSGAFPTLASIGTVREAPDTRAEGSLPELTEPARLRTRLWAPQPNPFNPITTLQYSIDNESHVSLRIYDSRGRRVVTLLDEWKPVGIHSVDWLGLDENGVSVASGVYHIRMQVNDLDLRKTVTVMK